VSDISQKLFSAAATAAALPFAVTGVEVAFLPNSPLRLPTSSGEEHIRNSEKEYEGELISEEVADKAYNLVDGLEETGDVVKVWTNVSGL
jgi:transcriptional/translational regulatory protein YebC/TACO1